MFTHFDEEVQPNQDGNSTSSLHGGGGSITNVSVQDIYPGDTVEHLGIGTYDSAAYALASTRSTTPARPIPRGSHAACARSR